MIVEAPLIAFAWAGLAEVALTSCFLVLAYMNNHNSMRAWQYHRKVVRELLSQSWLLSLSSLAIMIYMRIDQVMIGQMLDDKAVGLFSAAVRISEMWYFVPMALASSVFPTIIASKKLSEAVYYARLQKLFTLMLWLAISVAVVVTFFRKLIIELLYGATYADSGIVLAIHVWAGTFVALGVASSGWFIVENLQRLNFYRTLSGAIVNIALNYLLIPKYGIAGAAVATVASYGMAAFAFDILNHQTRRIFWMKIRAINPIHLIILK